MEHRGAASGVRKGSWTEEEDVLLRKCIEKYGEGKWRHVPSRAGLNRCRKSCRLRWLNYLRPNLKRGQFAQDEVDLIIRMHKLLGNRWALIAGRLPGRTANDVKNYWNSHLNKISVSKKVELVSRIEDINTTSIRIMETNEVIKPHPLSFSKNSQWSIGNNHSSSMETCNGFTDMLISSKSSSPTPSSGADLDIRDESMVWLENILLDKEEGEEEEKITSSSSSSVGVGDVKMELGSGKTKEESFVGQYKNDWELYIEGNENGSDLWHLLLPQLEKK